MASTELNVLDQLYLHLDREDEPWSVHLEVAVSGELDEAQSRELHGEVAKRVEESGKFWISTTELKGRMYFRISPVNFRTRMEHMDQLLLLLEQECGSVLQSLSTSKSSV